MFMARLAGVPEAEGKGASAECPRRGLRLSFKH